MAVNNEDVQSGFVWTSIDLPQDLHQRLHELAARKGCSASQLVLQSIEHAVYDMSRKQLLKRLSLEPPIVPSTGKPIVLTNDQIYGRNEYP